MTQEIKLLDMVALLQDMPEHGLVRGQVGTVVEELAQGVCEVEFCNSKGATYALATVQAHQLIRLLFQPVETKP